MFVKKGNTNDNKDVIPHIPLCIYDYDAICSETAQGAAEQLLVLMVYIYMNRET